MTPEQFVMWLKGFVEALGQNSPSVDQWGIIDQKLKSISSGYGLTDKYFGLQAGVVPNSQIAKSIGIGTAT